MLTAFMMYKVPKRKIVLVTEQINDYTLKIQNIIRNKCAPCTSMITLLRVDIVECDIFSYYLEDENPIALHICENYTCNEPIYDVDEMMDELNNIILSTLT